MPQEISERKGDFYVIKIKVAGKEREIFYTPKHMTALEALAKETEKGFES